MHALQVSSRNNFRTHKAMNSVVTSSPQEAVNMRHIACGRCLNFWFWKCSSKVFVAHANQLCPICAGPWSRIKAENKCPLSLVQTMSLSCCEINLGGREISKSHSTTTCWLPSSPHRFHYTECVCTPLMFSTANDSRQTFLMTGPRKTDPYWNSPLMAMPAVKNFSSCPVVQLLLRVFCHESSNLQLHHQEINESLLKFYITLPLFPCVSTCIILIHT